MKRLFFISFVFFLLIPFNTIAKPKLIKHGYYAFWELSDNGVLTISGVGPTPNLKWHKSPWYKKRDLIKEITSVH